MPSTPLSVYSDLDQRPPGISCFNLKVLTKEKQLRALILRDDTEIAHPLRTVDFESNEPIGVVAKQSSGKNSHAVAHSYQISSQSASGPLDPAADYVGMVLYFKATEVDCESGYIYYQKTADIKYHERTRGNRQVCGKLYASLFGEEPDSDVVASGFAIRQGLKWRFNSGTFHSWQKQRHMGRSEQKIVKAAIERFASRHQSSCGHSVLPVSKDPSETASLLPSAAQVTEQIDQLSIHEGQSLLPAQGASRNSKSGRRYTSLHKATVRISARWRWNTSKQFACLCTCLVPYRIDRNSISVHITWKHGSKQKSITMQRSLHCMCYQLLLDIQAYTGKQASEHVLLHHGVELPLRESISSAGLCNGDILVLQSVRTSLRTAVLPSTDKTSEGSWSQRQMKHVGLPTVAE